MMIAYENKISRVLNIAKYVFAVGALPLVILYWVKTMEIFLTLVFACMASFLFCGGLANVLEIKHCLRKEEKSALKTLGFGSLIGAAIFVAIILSRIGK